MSRQETPHCTSVSFDRHAANAFQSYVHGAIAFSIKRGGLLYGTVGEGGKVSVEAIYEPPQVSFQLHVATVSNLVSHRCRSTVQMLLSHMHSSASASQAIVHADRSKFETLQRGLER